jgi:hypothetical protein
MESLEQARPYSKDMRIDTWNTHKGQVTGYSDNDDQFVYYIELGQLQPLRPLLDLLCTPDLVRVLQRALTALLDPVSI